MILGAGANQGIESYNADLDKVSKYLEENGYFFDLERGERVIIARKLSEIKTTFSEERSVVVVEPELYASLNAVTAELSLLGIVPTGTGGEHVSRLGKTFIFNRLVDRDKKGDLLSNVRMGMMAEHEADHLYFLYLNDKRKTESGGVGNSQIDVLSLEASAYCIEIAALKNNEELLSEFAESLKFIKYTLPLGFFRGEKVNLENLEVHTRVRVEILLHLGNDFFGNSEIFLGLLSNPQDNFKEHLISLGVDPKRVREGLTFLRTRIYKHYFGQDFEPIQGLFVEKNNEGLP